MIDLIRVLLNETGVTILLVEHNLGVIMDLCNRILVLNFGTKIAEGSPDEIREDQRVIEAHLGVDSHAA